MSIFDKKRRALIQKYEGYRPDAYQLKDEDFYTIGYGSTTYEDGTPIGPNDLIDEARAQELLDYHIERTRGPVSQIEGYGTLPPNAKVAIDSFAYNVGPNFINDDSNFGTINRAIRESNADAIADALPLYTNSGLEGLVRRRADEAALAVTPAMDPIDSTLANDRTRAFGTPAVLNGEPVKWGGKTYGWQSPESFATIEDPTPEMNANSGVRKAGRIFGMF